jgi:hypothetical protein
VSKAERLRASLDRRSKKLAAAEADLERRELESAERLRSSHEQKSQELAAAHAERERRELEKTERSRASLDRRSKELADAEAELERRRAALDRRTAEMNAKSAAHAREQSSLEALTRDFAEQRTALEERARRAEARPPVLPPVQPVDEALMRRIPRATGGWTIDRLERLIRAHGDRFPDRCDEWQSYLFYLREHADASGRLPQTFDARLDEVFDPISK